MHLKSLLSSICLSMLMSAAWADGPMLLDKDFSLHLDKPTPAPSLPLDIPLNPPAAQPPRTAPETLKMPNGELLPPGTRQYKFNGLPYYIIPL